MAQHRPATNRHVLDPAKMQPILHELMPCSEKDVPPAQVVGWVRKRIFTRLRADYANGWTIYVNFDRAGNVTSTSARKRLVAKGKVRANCPPPADSDGNDGA